MSDPTPSLESLKLQLRQFAADRDWNQFHSPKNLAAALSVEAAELLEPFQWLTEEQSRNLSPEKLEAVRDKIVENAAKYPVEKARGSMRKYTDL